MQLFRGLVGASFAVLTTIAVGCTNTTDNKTASTPAPAQPSTPATIATNSAPGTIKIVFPTRSGTTDLKQSSEAVVKFLSKESGLSLEAIVADDAAAVEALRANQADVAFLSSRPALKAEKLANSKLYLAEVRANYSGGNTYRSVFVVPKDSPLVSSDDAKTALEPLKGKTIAFTSPTSGSGFIFPVGELVKTGLVPDRDRLNQFFGQVTYGGDYGKALQAILKGQAEVAAVSEYALAAPYITEEESKKLRVLHGIPGVPAHGIAIDDDLPVEQRDKLIQALLKLNQSENKQLLTQLYNSTELVKIDHEKHLAPMREAAQRAGME
jgi:phosphonate transport system substrate-binding protein